MPPKKDTQLKKRDAKAKDKQNAGLAKAQGKPDKSVSASASSGPV